MIRGLGDMMCGVNDSARPIVIDAREVRPTATGVGRSTLCLLKALVTLAPDQPFILLIDTPQSASLFPTLPNLRLLTVPYAPQQHPRADWWLNLRLPPLLRRLNAQLYHGPAFLIPQRRLAVPAVLTVHDLSMFEPRRYYPPAFRAYLQGVIRRGVRVARHVVAVSEAVRQEIVQRFGLPCERVSVVHNALVREIADHPQARRDFLHQMRLPMQYVLAVGTLEPRKNPLVLAEALRLLPEWKRPLLVWAGRSGHHSGTLYRAMLKCLGSAGIRWVSGVGDGDLDHLMRGATALANPSLSEGFGMPLLEGMAARTPVVASDIAAHREVGAQAVLYAAAESPEDWAGRIESLLNDSVRRQVLVEAGQERLKQFGWPESARALLGAYRAATGEAADRAKAGLDGSPASS